MPSPDLTPFIDLSLNDKTAQELFDASKALLLERIPTWIPREANVEVLLLEALSTQLSELIYAINRLPNNVVQGLFELQDLPRDAGTAPTVDLEFTMVDDAGYEILAGTQVLLQSGDLQLVLTTDEALVIPPLSTTGSVSATGNELSSSYNGITSADLSMIDGLIYVDSVALDGTIAGGADPETDDEYFTRASAIFRRLSTSLVLPSHFTTYALENPAVFRATTLDNYDPDDSGSAPGLTGGHVTVVVYGESGAVSGPVQLALLAEMEAIALANLQIHVEDAVINTVDVTATVQALPDWELATVQANVEAALEDYLSIAKWNWADDVLRNNLIAVMTYAEGVSHVVSLTTPAADINFTTYGNLVEAGTLSITVT